MMLADANLKDGLSSASLEIYTRLKKKGAGPVRDVER
jgi:hypothetical protein